MQSSGVVISRAPCARANRMLSRMRSRDPLKSSGIDGKVAAATVTYDIARALVICGYGCEMR
jgi:hypothetical protein